MFALTPGVDPTNYLSCLAERNRALHLHDRTSEKLCAALGCNKREVDMAILKARVRGRIPQSIREAIDELNLAEQLLDKTCTLVEIAEEICAARLNSDLKEIEC